MVRTLKRIVSNAFESPIARFTVIHSVDKVEGNFKAHFLISHRLSPLPPPLSGAIIGDFAFPDSISAPAPTPNTDFCFLPLYFPPKKVLCLCIFLPCHVYIPSIHSTQWEWIPVGIAAHKDLHQPVKGCSKTLWRAENIQVISFENCCNPICTKESVGHGTFLVFWKLWKDFCECREAQHEHLATSAKMQQTSFICADIFIHCSLANYWVKKRL